MLSATMQEVCESVYASAAEMARELVRKGTLPMTAAADAIFASWNMPNIVKAPMASSRTPGSLSRRPIDAVLDSIKIPADLNELPEAAADLYVTAVMQRIRVAYQLSTKLSTQSEFIRWQDVLALSSEGETGDLIENFTVDGELLTELVIAALTGRADL